MLAHTKLVFFVFFYSCVLVVQGWENIDGAALQLCAACNLPWLDTSFQLAPDAEMDSGMYLCDMYSYLRTPQVQTLRLASTTQSDCKVGAVSLVAVVFFFSFYVVFFFV